jgi:hypothetical protein
MENITFLTAKRPLIWKVALTNNITFNTVILFIKYNVYTYSCPRNGMYKCLVAEETILRTHFGFPST